MSIKKFEIDFSEEYNNHFQDLTENELQELRNFVDYEIEARYSHTVFKWKNNIILVKEPRCWLETEKIVDYQKFLTEKVTSKYKSRENALDFNLEYQFSIKVDCERNLIKPRHVNMMLELHASDPLKKLIEETIEGCKKYDIPLKN